METIRTRGHDWSRLQSLIEAISQSKEFAAETYVAYFFPWHVLSQPARAREFKIEPSTPAYGARGTGVRSSTRSIPSPVPGALGHACPACGIAWPVPCANETPPASTKTDSDTTRQHHHQPEEESQSAVSAASTTITTAPEIAPTPFSAAIPDPSDNMPKASAKGCVNQGSADPGYACGGWGHLYCAHVTAIDISACDVARRLGFDSVIQPREPIFKNGCSILLMRA